MSFSPAIDSLIKSLSRMPGVGPKSAQRIALHILERDQAIGHDIAKALVTAIEKVKHCKKCRTLTEYDLCEICASKSRDEHQLCIVENPTDIHAIEQSGEYQGRYFVLHGNISPLDGIGPEQIGIPELLDLIDDSEINEVIIATSATVEGEATAYFIAGELSEYSIKTSRIAHGIPLGGELEYVDGGTIARALNSRTSIN